MTVPYTKENLDELYASYEAGTIDPGWLFDYARLRDHRIEALETALRDLVDSDDTSEAFYDAFGHCRFCGYQARHTKTCVLAIARAALEGDDE